MKHPKRIISGLLLIAVLPLAAQAYRPRPKNRHVSNASSDEADRGQKVFEQNCSRCHNAPEGFSPGISGTIAMHMRARANISEADYRALRRFFNP